MKFVSFLKISGVTAVAMILAMTLTAPTETQARWLKKSEAGSVIEKFHHDYQVKKDGTWDQTVEYVIRVQSEDAKANVSLLNVEYNAMTEKVEILAAYTQNGKTKVNVEKSAIEDRDKGESRDYDVQKVRSVLYPQVQVGSRLHLSYRLSSSKPIIKDTWSTVVQYSPAYHTESARVRVVSEKPLFYELKDSRQLFSVKKISDKELLLTNRKELPGWVHAEKDPYFHPEGSSQFWVSTHKEWPAFFAELAKGYENIVSSEIPAALKPWVKQAQNLKTPEAKILFLMEKMSKDFRYFGDWRRHDGGFVPRPLNEIEKSRYGDCKDLSSILAAMLRHLQLDAHVALVRRGENPWNLEPDYKLPNTSRFNHAMVHAKSGEKVFWLDPTNPVSALKPFPDISGRPAWILKKSGGEFARLPEPLPKEFTHVHEYQYRFKSGDSVLVDVKADMQDLAPHNLANSLMLSPRSQVLSEALEYFSEGHEVRRFKYRREPQTSRTLQDMKVDLEYEAGRVTFNAGKASFWVIPDGVLEGAFYETEQRESDLRLGDSPYVFKGARRLKQTRLAQEPPTPCKVESEWMNLDRNVKVEGNDVVIYQTMELKKPFIQRAEFRTAAFKKLQAESKQCFHRSGLLIEPVVR